VRNLLAALCAMDSLQYAERDIYNEGYESMSAASAEISIYAT